jgi:maltooligosyltrehalose trehalohydrolase
VDDLSVWAPKAKTVEVEAGGQRRALRRLDDHGWWTLGEPLAPGTDYTLRLDGGASLPDPRSPWQPRGVHGPSRAFDPTSFPWTDAGWSPTPLGDGLLYELHVGTFTPEGTFDAAIERLEHLVDLGVTHVELLPVAEFAGERGWGYDGVSLYAPHHAYGGPAGLLRLVDACHARGLSVLLDVVYNHLGPEGNYLRAFGPYFSETASTPWGPAMNLDGAESAAVRRYLLDNAARWLRDFHLDGLRVDAVHALHDGSKVHLLEELARETDDLSRTLGRRLVLVAETNRHEPRTVTALDAGGHGFDAQWCDDLHHALHAALTGERAGWYEDFGSLEHVATALTKGYVLPPGTPSPKRRREGKRRPPTQKGLAPLSGHCFLGYLQNHDQTGNRARGERIAHLVGPDLARAAAALVLCAPAVPMLFMGEEWGASAPWMFFSDHGDPWLGPAVREGRLREFGAPWGLGADDMPDPQAPATFEASKLAWDERALPWHAAFLDWYRALARLRRERADLRDGRLDKAAVLRDEEARWLSLGRARTAVALNLAKNAQVVPLPKLPGVPHLLLASRGGVTLSGATVHLPPGAAAVVGV